MKSIDNRENYTGLWKSVNTCLKTPEFLPNAYQKCVQAGESNVYQKGQWYVDDERIYTAKSQCIGGTLP